MGPALVSCRIAFASQGVLSCGTLVGAGCGLEPPWLCGRAITRPTASDVVAAGLVPPGSVSCWPTSERPLCRLPIIKVTPTANTTNAAATATAAHTGCVNFAIQGGGCQPVLADDPVTCPGSPNLPAPPSEAPARPSRVPAQPGEGPRQSTLQLTRWSVSPRGRAYRRVGQAHRRLGLVLLLRSQRLMTRLALLRPRPGERRLR